MPEYVIQRTMEALNSVKKPLNGSHVLVVGLAYKPNVDDMRESPAFHVMELLHKHGALIDYYDPHIPVITPTREHADWTGRKSVAWTREGIVGHDIAVVVTNHEATNYQALADWVPLIVDTRNAMAAYKTNDGQVWKS
jgi:UDP-N-acetyl-D-glucosamine dehydrogenase